MTIQIQQASVKFLIETPEVVDLDAFIPIFHAWIRDKRIDDQLLIDVADYRHVPNGPGVMLIANEAHYGIDGTGGELGLRYLRRRDALGDPKATLADALRRAARAAALVEAEESLGGALKFRTDSVQMRILSRLTASNTTETRSEIEPVWTEVLKEAGYEGTRFDGEPDPRSPFGLRLGASTRSPDLAALQAGL